MEIEGRECKEVKIGEHSYWFIEKYKGGDVRKMMGIVLSSGEDIKAFNPKNVITRIPEIFILLCIRIDEDVTPTEEYIDNLPVSEYMEVQNKLMEEVANLFTEIK